MALGRIGIQQMFHTPEEWTYVTKWIDLHPPEERAHLWTAAMMTWNYLARKTLPPEEFDENDEFWECLSQMVEQAHDAIEEKIDSEFEDYSKPYGEDVAKEAKSFLLDLVMVYN